MRAVVQKVLEADIEVVNNVDLVHVNHIDRGLVALLGIGKDDNHTDIAYIADKLAYMRIFADDDGKMNHSVQDIDRNER